MTVNTITTAAMLGAIAAATYADDALAHGKGHGNGHAYGRETQYVYARVVDVDPIVRYVTVDRPREQCWGFGTRDVTVRRCEVVHERVTEERIDGYMVGYVYGGRHYTMRTPTPPGDRVRLAVDMYPVDVSPGFYRVRY